ncbi:helix-turn-helix domain-containing protein [Sphaerisporangium fuscum]|uniref:helix-turn-helix domain-containing protein n=1 Tax=Sphaerisporangium fuscum TaxID=2835868 RepID=UPI001BDBC649|nr:helix-turn-helix domain-containing protein [Sphaerisporangium fuscum]
MDTLTLLLHPVRLRIVHAMSGGRARTVSDLCADLADVPRTTVYRHVGLLAEAGVLEVVGEQRVHGAVERTYRLQRARTVIDREKAATMSLEDHREAFTTALGVLLSEFNAYLEREGADPFADSVGYTQSMYWLTPDELADLIRQVQAVMLAYRGNGPTAGRRPYLLSPILFPTGDTTTEDHS